MQIIRWKLFITPIGFHKNRQLIATVLKIDRSFIRGIQPKSKEYLLCQGIIAMAHALDIQVIAEGVETDTQRRLLGELGCDYAQGYLLGRPMTARDLEEQFLAQASVQVKATAS